MTESIRRSGRAAVGFGVGEPSIVRPIGKVRAFLMGSTLAGLGGVIAIALVQEGDRTLDEKVVDHIPVLGLAALGGGIASAIVAPSRT